ncbi:hypothetical protein NQ317_012260 [Molorchus minor]|uniref:Tyr recombinase domain-containing protein n=1 Tax=Molorchus minor TaxID=1323400 RepID=A0ABQ9K0G2_9CUCU|nr:hypothetical protein NQ317_012260 [Molorchus minor]
MTKEFLMIKVGLILGIAGACRTDELVNLTVDDIEDENVVRSQLAMGKIPSVVASYLKLPDVACYTGHCLRRSSATLLADAGVDITTIKRHAGWKSTTVAEGYVENSIENKTKIANQVLVVVVLDTTKEESLDWTRYPYGPQASTPGVEDVKSVLIITISNTKGYTGHALRGMSATFLVDGGGDLTCVKRHGLSKKNVNLGQP